MKRFALLAARLVVTLLFPAVEATAQSADAVLVREIAPCYQQVNIAIQSPQNYVPCKDPGINQVVIRKLAGNLRGVTVSYHDYSRVWARVFECDFQGTGPESGGVIALTPLPEAGTSAASCKILIKRTQVAPSNSITVDIQLGTSCESLCSHPAEAISVTGQPSIAFTPAFDCRKAVSPTEKTICVSWDLADQDLRLAELWANHPDVEKREAVQAQQRWLRERDQCQYDGRCIFQSYKRRFASLCTQTGRKIDAQGDCQP